MSSNLQDLAKFRATFGITYPTAKASIDRKDDGKEIQDRLISIQHHEKKLSKIKFWRCKPLYSHEIGSAEIADIFFEDCFFGSCFLGSATYKSVRFTRCKFDKSDFMNSRFIDCEFVRCEFTDCTAWNIKFEETTINPNAFMTGIPFPRRNYSSEIDSVINKEMRRYVSTTLPISRELLQSALSIHHTEYSDIATFLYKENILTNRIYQLVWDRGRYQGFAKRKGETIFGVIGDLLLIPVELANLTLTKGGTSLFRLVTMFLILNCIAFPFAYKFGSIANDKYSSTLSEAAYAQRILSSIEIFFSFGYTNYKSIGDIGRLLMVSQPIIGLIWFAFLVPVLLRRAYR